MNPIVALTAGIGVVSKMGMEAEKTSVAFNVLVGNEAKAAKMLGEINKYADNTLWDRATTQSAAQTMLGFGVSTETVVDDLKMLGDVAQGDKNRLQQLALVFGQISAAGKLQGQVRAAFQRATGEGGKFNNMTERIAQTAYGAFEQLKGKLISTLLELYNVIQPFIIPVLNALGKGLELISKMAAWASQHLNVLIPIVAGLTAGMAAYNVVANAGAIATKLLVGMFKLLNFVMSINPVGLVVAGIAALTVAIVACWNKFAGFRAVVITVWETVKGFGNILKQYVIDRLTGIVTGIGLVGSAIGKLFKGDFSGAWETAKSGVAQIQGIGAKASAISAVSDLAGGVRDRFSANLETERQKQSAKNSISAPTAAGGAGALAGTGAAAGSGAGTSPSSTANAITTGGTRNTSIVLNIGKFFEDVNINNVEGRDFRQLRDAVLESINRSLEIAVSAAR